MGNKLKFLKEYNGYIENIENLNDKEDISMFNEFEKYTKNNNLILLEGLITTHPIDKSIKIIKKRFNNLNIEKQEDGEIYIENINDEIKAYLPLFNNLGYFISLMTLDGEEWTKDYNDDIKPIAIILEPKYDLKIEPIPNILYHTSPIKFKDKISKIGFIPKTGNKLSKHPDRIYLTDNFDIAMYFGLNIKKEENVGFCIYEINGEKLNNLYSDINLKDGGYYTLENISPKNFKLIKTIE